jgi:O-antigen/teichoic acid export membrane protein
MSKYRALISKIKQTALNNYRALGSSYFSMIVNAMIFIFLTPFLLKGLGKEQYGIWILLTNIITYFSLSNFGFNTSFMVELPAVAKDPEKKNELVNTVFFTLLTMGLLFSVFFVIISFNLGNFFEIPAGLTDAATIAFSFIFVSFLISIFYGFFDSILYINNYIFEKNTLEITKIVLTNFLFLLCVFFSFDLPGMGLAQFVSFGIFLVIIYVYTKRKFPFVINPSYYKKELFLRLLNPSFHYFFITIASQIVYYSDSILISTLSGVGDVGIYAVMYKLTEVFLRVFFKLTDVKLPRIAQLWAEQKYMDLIRFHNKLQVVTLVVVLPVFVALFFFGTEILELWVGDQYVFDENIMRVLTLSMVLNTIIHVTGVFVIVMGTHKYVSRMSLVEAALNILLSILFYQYLGLIGIPLGTLVSSLATTGWFILYNFYGTLNSLQRKLDSSI